MWEWERTTPVSPTLAHEGGVFEGVIAEEVNEICQTGTSYDVVTFLS